MKIFKIKNKKYFLSKVAFALSLLMISPVLAQDSPATSGSQMSAQELILLTLIGSVIVVCILVLITTLYAASVLYSLYQKQKTGIAGQTIWKLMMDKMTLVVPVEKEADILLDHDYDGIKELDNHLPPWWVYMFYGTVAFAFIYMMIYHVFNWAPLSREEYQIAMETAAVEVAAYREQMANSIDETNVQFVKEDEEALVAGETIYVENCATCHGQLLEGGTGPNLTDEFWIHGGGIKNVFSTIKYGVAQKGMISWEKKLKPDQIQNVASFILTKQGTNPPNAKEAQGDKYVPEEE
ncbi:MAG: cbb3-type cytochrome c oxidase N-terminal domain-containing protein [Bacteroidota bacterium]